ncbi:hypothetical protein HMPREF1624_01901 [Sporothrix schenckii ATCC 58251]|uniref:Ysc84 actin-binding domain-containing protein n=1 Tax=Sporothrix schenckii (strain ATCC 58251 / de Perez 2211183) TaxID=1391915 RepID=U7Q1T9_SPOS1|nr:hypothetical protein HMPREF1624_01901 [Sporothrix schenckii ATCC 58251]
MEKVTSRLPSWDTTKTKSKQGFDKVWGWADKLGAPVNRFSNRIGSEAFWPTTLDKESDKAARILRSFCKDGFYTEIEKPSGPDRDGPKSKQRVLKKIPQKVIQKAVGLAIFTTMRTGLWISGAGGSGVLVARKEDGTWSEPSGILLHTAGLGFLVGVDIYDCVLVINNRKALASFTKLRATLGGEISAVAGPVGAGGVLENDGKWKEMNRPVFTYLKSRGFYAGVQVDGTIIVERTDENKRFYHQEIAAVDILAGKVRHRPPEVSMLMETLKAAEGRTDVDEELMDELEGQPAPGDVDIEAPVSLFGVPDPEDPDPYGVLALEKEGLEIREAATNSRPASEVFAFNPSPKSPVYSAFHNGHRRTQSSLSQRWSMDRRPAVTMADMATQTDPVLIEPHPDAEAIMAAMAAAEAAEAEREREALREKERQKEASNSATGLVVPDAIDEDEERSVYEDVPDAPQVDSDGRGARGVAINTNPWSNESGNPYRDETKLNVVSFPRGPPPPLPPRTAVAKPVETFEEVNLNGGDSLVTNTDRFDDILFVDKDGANEKEKMDTGIVEKTTAEHNGEKETDKDVSSTKEPAEKTEELSEKIAARAEETLDKTAEVKTD